MKEIEKLKNNEFIVRPYTRKELREMYGIPYPTFRRWLEPLVKEWGLKRFRYFSPQQVERIISEFGIPSRKLNDKNYK